MSIYLYKGYIKPGETSKWGKLNTHTNYFTDYRFLKNLSIKRFLAGPKLVSLPV